MIDKPLLLADKPNSTRISSRWRLSSLSVTLLTCIQFLYRQTLVTLDEDSLHREDVLVLLSLFAKSTSTPKSQPLLRSCSVLTLALWQVPAT